MTKGARVGEQSGAVTVLTTLPVMYQALLGQLDEVERWPVGAREFVACGRLAGSSWRVAPVLVGGYDRAAAVIAERVGEAEPTALFFADLVNCLEDDIALGDVVVATEVHHELAGPYSVGLGGPPRPWQPPVPLVQDASAALTDGRWRDRIAPGVLLTGRPAIHFEPIVSGGAPLDVTVGEVAGGVAESLSGDHRDAVAVDDGRAGSALAYLRRARQALVVCGVGGRAQDAGQAVDTDGSRSRAAASAAAAVSSVIAGLPRGSRPVQPVTPSPPRSPPRSPQHGSDLRAGPAVTAATAVTTTSSTESSRARR